MADCRYTAAVNEDLVDLLLDMKHDLGKYIVMPVAMLPADAPQQALRDALHRALRETRPTGGAARSAAELWEGFVAEGGQPLRELSGFSAVEAAMTTAANWNRSLDNEAPIDRQALLSDLRTVGETIGSLIATARGAQ